MILNNAKIEKELYIVQDLLQDSKPDGAMEYARNSAENAKDMLECSDSVYLCNPTGLR